MHNALFGAFVHYRRTGEIIDVWRHRHFQLSAQHEEIIDDFDGAVSACRSANIMEEPGPILLPPTRYRALVAGDDSVIFQLPPAADERDLRDSFFDSFGAAARRVGQIVTGTHHYEHHQNVSFCSGLFWPLDGDTYLFGPKPTSILMKHPYQKVSFRVGRDPSLHGQSGLAALRGTALGLWPSCRRIPILREYLQAILSKTRSTSAKTIAANPLYTPDSIIAETNDHFAGHQPAALAFTWVRYGIDHDKLLDFSRYMRTVPLPFEGDFPAFRQVYAVDRL
jgi:hypothetical protein